jgi:hypothetical protein
MRVRGWTPFRMGVPEWVVEVEQKVEQFDQAVALFL